MNLKPVSRRPSASCSPSSSGWWRVASASVWVVGAGHTATPKALHISSSVTFQYVIQGSHRWPRLCLSFWVAKKKVVHRLLLEWTHCRGMARLSLVQPGDKYSL